MALRGIMAVSRDGFVARGPKDDMSWTGTLYKKLFYVLTNVGGVVGMGARSAAQLPDTPLPGRRLIWLTQAKNPQNRGIWDDDVMSLEHLADTYPGAWLAGGQTIMLAALEEEMLSEIHLCRLSQDAFGSMDSWEKVSEGIEDRITPWLTRDWSWNSDSNSNVHIAGQLQVIDVALWHNVYADEHPTYDAEEPANVHDK